MFILSLTVILIHVFASEFFSRYDERSNELINEELGIAYPIIDGIPNMIPQDARMIHTTETTEKPTES